MYKEFKYHDLEAVRVGKIGSKINTTCLLYRLNETVIDTGPPNQWKEVQRFLDEKKPENILITHYHEDHSGNGALIQKKYDSNILCNPKSVEKCEKGFLVEFYRRFTWGKPEKFLPKENTEKIETDSGLVFLPINAQGHSEDMTCYLEKTRGWIFTGDLYISSKITHSRDEENPYLEIESLKRVLEYDFETVFCSHRGVIEDGKKALNKKLSYLTEVKERVIELKKQGKSLSETSRIIMGKEDLFTYMTLFYFSKKQFIKSFWDNI